VPGKESDEYFATRTLESRVSAIVSEQSSVIPSRQFLEDAVQDFLKKNKGKTIKRPAYWGGYRVKPFQIEFWQEVEHRLHERMQYRLEKGKWMTERLSP
jgi:pyridoxamine 5'-phosphate oxidase